MFCWQARRGFAEKLEGIAGLADSPLDRHLSVCVGCTAELEGLRQLRSLLSESARTTTLSTEAASSEAAAFEERVLRLARSRAALAGHPPLHPPLAFRWPVAAAFSLMVAAVVLSRFLSGAVPPGGSIPNAVPVSSQTAAANDLDDRIVAPQEVPFVVQEDLVGERRGRIPLTTYVLEPAPDEQSVPRTGAGKPVMRASL